METEITLEELSDRHPEVEKVINQVTFEIDVTPTSPPPDDGGWTAKKVARDVVIGVAVTILMMFVSPYVVALTNFLP